MNLRTRLTITLLAMSLIPLGVSSYLDYDNAQRSLEENIFSKLSLSVDIKKNVIEEKIEDTFQILNSLSKTPIIIESLSEIEIYIDANELDGATFVKSTKYLELTSDVDKFLSQLLGIEESAQDYYDVFMLDHNGVVVFSSKEESDLGTSLVSGPFSKTSFGTAVRAVLQNKEVGFGNFESYEPSNNELAAFFASPIFHEDGDLHGIIAVQIPIAQVNMTIMDRTGLGETGEALLAKRDENGDAEFIASLKYEYKENIVSKERLDIPITQALLGREDVFPDTLDYRNIPVLSATRYIESVDWGVVAKIDISEAYAPVYTLRNNSLYMLTIVMFSVIFIAFFLSERIFRPIKKLKIAVQEIGEQGKDSEVLGLWRLSDPKLVESNDEIGDLARAFSEMISERQKMEKKLVSSEKLVAVGKLAGTVGHELRNPLAVISNSAFYLNMTNKGKDAKSTKHLKIIMKEIERSNLIISDLLDFSRLKPPVLEEGDLNQVIKEFGTNFEVPDNVTIKTELDLGIPKILLDTERIRRVFLNIQLNAIQAMPEGGTLTISSGVVGGFAVVRFIDTGEGISKENLEHIFEPLFTTKAKGTGLGLVVAKSTIEGHKGRIEVDSKLGKGTTFTLMLPLK